MKVSNQISLLFVALCFSGALLAACQSLAGITDRTYVDSSSSAGLTGESGAGGATASQCNDYCDEIANLCTIANKDEQYTGDTCIKTCELFRVGEPSDPMDSNTLLCRLTKVQLQSSTNEQPLLRAACSSAGPGGADQCGSNCESYCFLYRQACKDQIPDSLNAIYSQDTCVSRCEGLADLGSYDDRDQGGDTIQCRLYHTSAATVDPVTHCPHAQLPAQPADSGNPCVDDENSMPDCPSFCKLEMAECPSGDLQMYDDTAQCEAVCEALPKGMIKDTSQNTIGCRKYHSYNAMLDAATHCVHTGPGGDGVCGDPETGDCASYCILAKAACSTGTPDVDPLHSFETKYVDTPGCMKACSMVPRGSNYSLNAKGNNVQCLLLHASRAFSAPADECAAALGAAPCE